MALPSHTYNLDDGAETEEDNSDAASCYVGDANEDYEEYAPDRHTPNTPQTNTPTPLAWGPAGFGTLYKEEIPNSIKDINVKNTPPPRKSSWSFESDRTVLIPGGTKITPKPQPKYPLHSRGINCNGRLPSEDPRYALASSMDEDATQPSTQPFVDPRRLGRNTSGLSNDDESDVICIIHPCSPAAYEAVQIVASTSPQHILQNDGLSRYLEEVEDPGASLTVPAEEYLTEETPYDDAAFRDKNPPTQRTKRSDKELTTSRDKSNTLDIALRLSSRLYKPYMGFCFGRNSKKCDIVLGVQNDERRVSGMHFRIYLNQEAIVMLQDVSTNGTVVDGNLLRSKAAGTRFPQSRMIQQGSVIQLITSDPKDEIKFIVSMPARDRAADRYQLRLEEYLAYIAQAERQAEAVARAEAEGNAMGLPTVAVHPLKEPVKVPAPTTAASKPHLVSASSKNTYGMHWNGGEKYNVAGYIGKGAFAMVYKLATIDNGKVFAVKELEKRKFMKNGILDHKVNNELKIIRTLRHPNIVKYIDHADIPRYLYIIMEYVAGGELLSYISLKGAMPEYMCQSVARQILNALEYLHKCKITHRDIKPDNILIDTTDPLVVKLSDFGLSKVVKDQETFLKTFCGTLLYCAPEVYPDYERYKLGLPRKRRRAHELIPRTSPYGHAVDIWSFGAVLFHLSSSKPPYMGSADDRGALMLEHIMTTTLDVEPLKQSGVSANGIDFIKKMLVLEPDLRSTERQCLKHPWLATSGAVDDEAMEVDDQPVGLNAIHEENEGEDLDASQLSLADDHAKAGAHDGENSDYLEVDEIDHVRKSKRMKFETGYVSRGRPDIASSGEVPYPTLPLMRSIESDALNTNTNAPPANRLFGEIGSSALRSSGVLGHDAHMALQMQMQVQGSRGDTASLSRSGPNVNIDVNDDQVRVIHDEFIQHKLNHPQTVNPPSGELVQTTSASSLLGAEELVGQLNMASPEPGASAVSAPNTAPAVSGTPSSQDQSPSFTTALAGSKRSSTERQDNSCGNTSKRSKFDRRIKLDRTPAFYYEPHDPSTWNYAYASKVSGRDYVGEYAARCQTELAESRAKSISEDRTFDESEEMAIREKYRENATVSIVAINEPDPEKRKKLEINRHLWEEHRREVEAYQSKLYGTPEPSLTSKSTAGYKDDKFVKPPPRLGKLTTVPGSIFEASLKLTERVTTWGRDPDSTIQYKNTKDTRVPKNAFEITFWRSGIEKAMKKGEDWTKMPNVFAIITTRAQRYIKVNGVRLTRFADEGDGWLYGRLFTGDIVTVWDYNGEFLKFKCEFFWGASKESRPTGQLFVVEKQTDKFQELALESLRRSREKSKTRSREATQSREGSAEGKTPVGTEIAKEKGREEEEEDEEGAPAVAAAASATTI